MTDPSIFSNQEAPATKPQESNVQPQDQLADLLASVKNERGEQKYANPIEALNALKHSQDYIPTLKNELTAKELELARLREENIRLKTVEETVAAFTARREDPPATPAAQGFDEQKIADLVAQQITQRETKATQQANVNSVVTTLRQALGADADRLFYEKGAELGMSQAEMNALAAKSPKAVFQMLGINATPQKTNVAPNSGSMNTAAYQPKQESFVGRNTKSAMIGATTEDLQMEAAASRKMVDELHDAGFTVADLSDPKIYRKYFK